MSIPDIASTRPTLAAWLAEYAAIEANYLASVSYTHLPPPKEGQLAKRDRNNGPLLS